MRHKTNLRILILLTLFAFHASSAHGAQQSIAGNWLGVLEVQGLKLRIVLKITQSPDGKLSAKMDSVDQAANDLPIDTLAPLN